MLAEDAVENRINMFEMIIEIELFFYLLSGQGGRDVGICLQQFHQRQCAIGFPDLHGIALDQAIRILAARSEEHTSELQSLMRISYAVFCLQKTKLDMSNTYIKTTTLCTYQ